jgi:hypothetical protein
MWSKERPFLLLEAIFSLQSVIIMIYTNTDEAQTTRAPPETLARFSRLGLGSLRHNVSRPL